MARKGRNDAKDSAPAEQAESENTLAAAAPAGGAETLVAGDGGGTAETGGAEHEGGAPGAADDAADAGGAEGGHAGALEVRQAETAEGEEPVDAGPDDRKVLDVLNDGDGSADASEPDEETIAKAMTDQLVADLGGDRSDFKFDLTLDQFIGDEQTLFPPFTGSTETFAGSAAAAMTSELVVRRLEHHFGGAASAVSILNRDIVLALKDFVEKIGERATPDVMAQQLVILKLRPNADLHPAEHLALEIFGLLTRRFAEHEKRLWDDARQRGATFVPPAPLPIEDTTMEPVSDTMDTW